jgi:hypothetical protein
LLRGLLDADESTHQQHLSQPSQTESQKLVLQFKQVTYFGHKLVRMMRQFGSRILVESLQIAKFNFHVVLSKIVVVLQLLTKEKVKIL